MKRLFIGAALVAAFVQVEAASVVYVDAVNGDDGYDGSSETFVSGTKGPKQSLAAAMGAVDLYGTVYALPGRYTNETMTTGTRLYRVIIPRGVNLISTKGADKTFIEGEPDPDVALNEKPFGCGPKAVSCSRIPESGSIRGFTLCNGHADGVDNGHAGGASSGARLWNAAIVDCVVSNNVAGRGGAIASVDHVVRCKFYNNRAVDGNAACGWECRSYIGCFFAANNKQYDVLAGSNGGTPAKFINCTSLNPEGLVQGSPAETIALVNCAVTGKSRGGCTYTNCLFTVSHEVSTSYVDPSCRVVSAAELQFDPVTGAPLKGANVGIDAGSCAAYEGIFPSAVLPDDIDLDGDGKSRVLNATIDVGAVEYDWRKDYAWAMSDGHVAITSVSPAVIENEAGEVEMPAGAEMTVDWRYPSAATGDRTFVFSAAVSGGELKVYRNGAAEPAYSLGAGTHEESFVASADQQLRFVQEGEGAATLFGMSNGTTVWIADEQGGLSVEGGVVGVNDVEGSSRTLTVSRNLTTAKICLGVNVNGEFYSFDGETADRPLALTVAPGDASVKVVPVYADKVRIYVDPEKGSDGNDGYTRFRAKKSLSAATAAAVADTVVFALPGVYSNETISVGGQLYRAKIAKDVSLVSEAGAERTVILGAEATTPVNDYGAGADAVSCVYFSGAGFLKGFTLQGGRRYNADQHGGAVRASSRGDGTVADCVFTNNVANRGGAGHLVGAYVRCRFFNNRATSQIASCLYEARNVFNCVFGPNYGQYAIYNNDGPSEGCVGNCTFLPGNTGSVRASLKRLQRVDNCLLYAPTIGGCTLHKCLYVTADTDTVNSFADETCRQFKADEMPLSANYRPVVGRNPCIDFADGDRYAETFPKNGFLTADEAAKDLWGTPRVAGAGLDIGAAELNCGQLSIVDSDTGLTVTGAAPGVTDVKLGETLEVSVSRNDTSDYRCTGIRVNGSLVSFDDKPEGWAWTGSVSGLDSALSIEAVYADHNDWYVDAEHGDDARDGRTAARAVKTLKRAMELERLRSGDVVHALPGIYREGVMAPVGDVTSNRVVIVAGVELVADGGPDVTAIEGFRDDSDHCGLGPAAIRGCKLRTGSVLRGFTVRNGGTKYNGQYGDCGGNVSGGGYVVDCVVTNGYAMRGGGVDSCTLIRTLVRDNTTPKTVADEYNSTAADANMISAFDSVIFGANYSNYSFVNCTLFGICWGARSVFCNCIVGTDGGQMSLTNCVVCSVKKNETTADAATKFQQKVAYDANYRPTAEMADLLIDCASNEYYAAFWPAQFASADFAGGQRVYNGKMDIGAGEFDWRGDFAKKLAKRRLVVTEAGPDVTAAEQGLNLAPGMSVAIDWTFKEDDVASFAYAIDGEGALTVKVDGHVVEPVEADKYSFPVSAGAVVVEISFAGEGTAEIGGFSGIKRGLMLQVR